jgi:hypothetical protein
MKKSDLKKLIKPIVEECVKEIILEKQGLLSSIVSEVAQGLNGNTQPIVEHKQTPKVDNKAAAEEAESRRLLALETKRKMLDAIGQSSYNGVDLFEGTTPMRAGGSPGAETQTQGPLSGMDPGDSGVDISNLMGNIGTWKALAEGKK